MLSKLNFTSIPNFIKEYIVRNRDNEDLKHFSEVTLDILNDSNFIESSEGYRTYFRGKLKSDDDSKLFIADVFLSYFKDKVLKVNGRSVYSVELDIGDYTSNEIFKVNYEDEFGDIEKMEIILHDYDNFTNTVSFMRV